MRLLLLLWLLLASSCALARDLSVEGGQCHFRLEKDGTFYQSNHYHSNYMTPSCFSIALADRFKDGPFGWRAAFLATGSIQARDNIATIFDEDAFSTTLVCNNTPGDPNQGQGCVGKFLGSGKTYGISVALTYERRLGPVRLMGETGLFFFRHSFHAEVAHVDCTTCEEFGNYDESSGPIATPSPLVGLTLRLGYVYVAARHYWPAAHRALSLTDHSFTQYSSGLIFKY